MEKLGIVVGSTKPNRVNFLSNKPLRLGQFVILKYFDGDEEIRLLGMINKVERENKYIPEDIPNYEKIDRLIKESSSETKVKGEIQILGKIAERDNGITLEFQRTPPLPASEVLKPPKEILERLFGSKGKNYIKIGKLLSEAEDVNVYIDINQIVLRHLAILAITGAGKSNTVSVLLDNIVNFKRNCCCV
jgi:Predicted ATPase